MNQGQKRFYNFILERIQDERHDEAKSLIMESFDKQADGSYGLEYMQSYIPKMTSMLKPEYVEEVHSIMTQFNG